MQIEKFFLRNQNLEINTFEQEGQLGVRKATPNYMNGVASSIAVIAIGLFSSESFRFGSYLGFAHLITKVVSAVLFSKESKSKSSYEKEVMEESAFDICIFAPILEEAIFRLGIQTCLRSLFAMTLPSSIVFLPFGVTLSSAAVGAILVSSVVFGAAHLSNDHDSVGTQAILAFSGGLIRGCLMETNGFLAACAAHIINNSVILLPFRIYLAGTKGTEPDESEPDSSIEVEFA